MRKATESYRSYSSLVKLQPRFLSLQWKTCLLGRIAALVPEFAVKYLSLGRTLMMMMMIYHHHQCPVEGQILHCKSGYLGCSSAEGRYSSANPGTKAEFYQGLNRCGSFPLLSAIYIYIYTRWKGNKCHYCN